MAYVVMARTIMAYIGMAGVVMPYVVTANVVMGLAQQVESNPTSGKPPTAASCRSLYGHASVRVRGHLPQRIVNCIHKKKTERKKHACVYVIPSAMLMRMYTLMARKAMTSKSKKCVHMHTKKIEHKKYARVY